MRKSIPIRDRINNYFVKTDTCWLWNGTIDKDGYGKIYSRVDGVFKNHSAHRVMYELTKGQIPNGMQIDHLCRKRNCVNPDHLEAVTPKENTMRGNTIARANSEKTVCRNGHSLESFYLIQNRRRCKACASNRNKAYLKRRTA